MESDVVQCLAFVMVEGVVIFTRTLAKHLAKWILAQSCFLVALGDISVDPETPRIARGTTYYYVKKIVNGEYMNAGLVEVELWCKKTKSEVGSSWDE
ncbi:hypothetical protein ZIOFF_013847 [Zingiber officinale]|uniref:Uncharacterized protein n=1 Tax=Zingiber officinale TaxID=94328 RepID=A0A8J5HNJ8_ZINOF|nr:hypothetical protein ZIOFF_013847 [Zingiber officinale]